MRSITPEADKSLEGLSDRGSGRLDLEAAWSSQQSAPARRASGHGAGDHSRALLGFRPDLGGGEAERVARVLVHKSAVGRGSAAIAVCQAMRCDTGMPSRVI